MRQRSRVAAAIGQHGFLLGLVMAILLAWAFPSFGSQDSPISWKPLINGGIALVFFFYGVKLHPQHLRQGLRNWKLHLMVQSFTFLIFPVLTQLILQFLPWIDSDFNLGISYLSVLPSTVSASVVMVNIAGGNVPAAIFNASVSSFFGVLITPAWMGFLEGQSRLQSLEFGSMYLDLGLKVILPVLVGIALHTSLFPKIQSSLNRLKYLDQTVIMIIVYTAFSDSFYQEVFDPYSWRMLLKIATTMLGIFGIMWGLILLLSSLLGFSLQDRITALFCGSKKSLVHGVVLGKVIFPNPAILGLVLLPVMLYHFQQLLIGSFLAQRFRQKTRGGV